MITTGIVVVVLLILLLASPKSLRRDLFFHARAFVCIVRRHHKLHEVGTLQKKSFRPIPVEQCSFCTMIVIREAVAMRFGAKRVG